jgi:hypothetical protein
MKWKKLIEKLFYFIWRFQKFIIIGLFIFFLALSGLTIYLNILGNNNLKKINNQRKNLTTLLGRWNNIKAQQKKVESELEKNKNFKLGFYINNLIKELNLDAKTGVTSTQQLGKLGYEEIIQSLSVDNFDTKRLVELLEKIENNELVYIKKLEIINQIKKISFTLTLATLQPKVSVNEK